MFWCRMASLLPGDPPAALLAATRAATWRAEAPVASARSGSAPSAQRVAAPAICRSRATIESGVVPATSSDLPWSGCGAIVRTLTSAPFPISRRITVGLALEAAEWSGIQPLRSGRPTPVAFASKRGKVSRAAAVWTEAPRWRAEPPA